MNIIFLIESNVFIKHLVYGLVQGIVPKLKAIAMLQGYRWRFFYTSYSPGAIRTLGDGNAVPSICSSPGIASVLRTLGSQIGLNS